MSSFFEQAKVTGLPGYFTATPVSRLEQCRKAYDDNRHHVYSIAFWMTDNELQAEAVMTATFEAAFSQENPGDTDIIDRALISEIHELSPIGRLSLNCAASREVVEARKNTKRVDLERAVVQIPATERLVFLMHDVERYDLDRIARLLEVTPETTRKALHQARLRIRELLATKHS